MFRMAIISLATLLLPVGTFAQASASPFGDKHVAFMAGRCPDQVRAYEALAPGTLNSVMESVPDAFPMFGVSEGFVTNELSQTDVHYGSFMVVNAMAIASYLKFGALFSETSEVSETELVETYAERKPQAQALVNLMECIWPTAEERAEVAESRWAEQFEKIATGICELQLYTMAQRYIDTPITHLNRAERQAVNDTLMADHDEYLEASKDASQCGEFL